MVNSEYILQNDTYDLLNVKFTNLEEAATLYVYI
jgi:hypothetical protein